MYKYSFSISVIIKAPESGLKIALDWRMSLEIGVTAFILPAGHCPARTLLPQALTAYGTVAIMGYTQ
ncbi:hypothetical protein [Trabulsiella guamensis]|uniref:hypothetical protein n=1 Tax=Trabulsiella guamensis TaxID=158852 RepID=UPI0009FDDB09|nr:hypothetical protein [Trabulsiella guamensis]